MHYYYYYYAKNKNKREEKQKKSEIWYECAMLDRAYHHAEFHRFHKKQCPRQHLTLMPSQRKGLILVVTYCMVFTNIPKAKCNNHTNFELNWTSVCKENITFDFIFLLQLWL